MLDVPRPARVLVGSVLAWLAASVLTAAFAPQTVPRDILRTRVQALEGLGAGNLDEAVTRLERDHLAPAYLARTPAEARRAAWEAIAAAAREADDVRVGPRDQGYVLTFQGRRTVEVAFTLEPAEPHRIATLAVGTPAAGPPAPALRLNRENLAETFDGLERSGLSGVVHVTLDGQIVLERPLGRANADLNVPMRMDTIFATGSQPTDLTAAAILLLDQRGLLRLDDRIDRFLPDVPADKRDMTIRHLMIGQSGLADFFHTADDWDPDLAWIDRTAAERRILAAPLRFAPGAGTAHSHAAYGLLAAIVERASGERYPAFLRRHLLDPAGMTRTGFYGEMGGFTLGDFAAGHGPSSVGLPNIPPNWGPTSWLVMGSGGMYSTMTDLVRFHAFVRSGPLLDAAHARRFRQATATRDGSDRGFELFHAYNPAGREALLLLNTSGSGPVVQRVFDALQQLVSSAGPPPA